MFPDYLDNGILAVMARMALHPNMPILRRRNGTVQLGADPERALVLNPTRELDTESLVALLQFLADEPTAENTAADLLGTDVEQVRKVVARLEAAGLMVRPAEPIGSAGPFRIVGSGPLADALYTGLRGLGITTQRSRHYRPAIDISRWRAQLVVLADDLVADPQLTDRLVETRVMHLQVRVRDGRGVVGPLVVPGRTSCLRCADLTRRDRDDEWPYLAAQLLGRHGHAHPATIAATSAIALEQLAAVASGQPPETLATANATLEVDLETHRIEPRPWPRHYACGC